MTSILIRKIIRDNLFFLLVVAALLFAFEGLWARVTYQVYEDFDKLGKIVTEEAQRLITEANKQGTFDKQSGEQLRQVLREKLPQKYQPFVEYLTDDVIQEITQALSRGSGKLNGENAAGNFQFATDLGTPEQKEEYDKLIKKFQQRFLKEGSGKLVQALIGGDSIELNRTADILSIGYVHPLVVIMLSIWAIGRAAGTIAGEVDRGTMELLLAQPIPRWRIIYSHFCADWLTIPVLCLAMWTGALLGCFIMDTVSNRPMWDTPVYLIQFPAASIHVAALLFALSGYTTFLSACGRVRNRVMGLAVVITLVQFLIDVIGQIWDAVSMFRPFTVFYYYKPQTIITQADWYAHPLMWGNLSVLIAIGTIGYGLALWKFQTRDVPAPL